MLHEVAYTVIHNGKTPKSGSDGLNSCQLMSHPTSKLQATVHLTWSVKALTLSVSLCMHKAKHTAAHGSAAEVRHHDFCSDRVCRINQLHVGKEMHYHSRHFSPKASILKKLSRLPLWSNHSKSLLVAFLFLTNYWLSFGLTNGHHRQVHISTSIWSCLVCKLVFLPACGEWSYWYTIHSQN